MERILETVLVIVVLVVDCQTQECPVGYEHRRNGNCYKFKGTTEGVKWKVAKEDCASDGGHLATITTPDEQLYIEELAAVQAGPAKFGFWIGLSRPAHGHFEWDSGETLDYTNWDTGNPDLAVTRAACVLMRRETGNQWRDVRCSQIRQYICEIDDILMARVQSCDIPLAPCGYPQFFQFNYTTNGLLDGDQAQLYAYFYYEGIGSAVVTTCREGTKATSVDLALFIDLTDSYLVNSDDTNAMKCAAPKQAAVSTSTRSYCFRVGSDASVIILKPETFSPGTYIVGMYGVDDKPIELVVSCFYYDQLEDD